jgi:hypothetical protein
MALVKRSLKGVVFGLKLGVKMPKLKLCLTRLKRFNHAESLNNRVLGDRKPRYPSIKVQEKEAQVKIT